MGKNSKILLVIIMAALMVLFQLLEQDLDKRLPMSSAPIARGVKPPLGARRTPRPRSQTPLPQPDLPDGVHLDARGGQVYTVQPGDTLSRIATRLLGPDASWQAIYEANRDRLPNPRQLSIGMELRVPERPR